MKHTTKPHLIGAIEIINTIDDYRPKIVRIIVFLLPSLIEQATLCNQNTVLIRIRQWLRVFSIAHYPVWKQTFFQQKHD